MSIKNHGNLLDNKKSKENEMLKSLDSFEHETHCLIERCSRLCCFIGFTIKVQHLN